MGMIKNLKDAKFKWKEDHLKVINEHFIIKTSDEYDFINNEIFECILYSDSRNYLDIIFSYLKGKTKPIIFSKNNVYSKKDLNRLIKNLDIISCIYNKKMSEKKIKEMDKMFR